MQRLHRHDPPDDDDDDDDDDESSRGPDPSAPDDKVDAFIDNPRSGVIVEESTRLRSSLRTRIPPTGAPSSRAESTARMVSR